MGQKVKSQKLKVKSWDDITVVIKLYFGPWVKIKSKHLRISFKSFEFLLLIFELNTKLLKKYSK